MKGFQIKKNLKFMADPTSHLLLLTTNKTRLFPNQITTPQSTPQNFLGFRRA